MKNAHISYWQTNIHHTAFAFNNYVNVENKPIAYVLFSFSCIFAFSSYIITILYIKLWEKNHCKILVENVKLNIDQYCRIVDRWFNEYIQQITKSKNIMTHKSIEKNVE